MTNLVVSRGEVWAVRFDPSEGDEIKKMRPAGVMSVAGAGRIQLHIVVPITGWQPPFARYFWMVKLTPTADNGLSKESAADAFQIKSVSAQRFQQKLGVLTSDQIEEIAAAIVLCVGYKSS